MDVEQHGSSRKRGTNSSRVGSTSFVDRQKLEIYDSTNRAEKVRQQSVERRRERSRDRVITAVARDINKRSRSGSKRSKNESKHGPFKVDGNEWRGERIEKAGSSRGNSDIDSDRSDTISTISCKSTSSQEDKNKVLIVRRETELDVVDKETGTEQDLKFRRNEARSDGNAKARIVKCERETSGLKRGSSASVLVTRCGAIPRTGRDLSGGRLGGNRVNSRDRNRTIPNSPRTTTDKRKSPRNSAVHRRDSKHKSIEVAKQSTRHKELDNVLVKQNSVENVGVKHSVQRKNIAQKSVEVVQQSQEYSEFDISHATFQDSDVSLRLSLKGLDDSDEDNESTSPRKERTPSPRKNLMSMTKSFEAKTSPIQRRESDGSLTKVQASSKLERGDICDEFIDINLSNDRNVSVNDLTKNSRRKASSSDNLVAAKENKEKFSEPVLNRSLLRSSGRKLPARPLPKSESDKGITEQSDTKKPLKKSDSENSFLSISKDGSTEYVSLDLNDGSLLLLQSSFEEDKSKSSPDTSIVSGNVSTTSSSSTSMETTSNKPKSAAAGARRVRSASNSEYSSARGQPSPRSAPSPRGAPPRGAPSPRGGPSVRETTTNKPPVERKSSRGTLSGVPPSPRGGPPASPRKSVSSASPRGTTTAARMSPRGPSPKGQSPRSNVVKSKPSSPRPVSERRASNEKLMKTVETVIPDKRRIRNGTDQGPNETVNGYMPQDTPKRSGSGFTSPRPSSPTKGRRPSHGVDAGSHRVAQIEEERPSRPRVLRQESCSGLDLQQIIATFSIDQSEGDTQARSETEVQSEKTWMDAERVWLMHKGGFASASQLKGDGYGLPEGRVKIRLDHDGEVLDVDEDDVEKANPPQLDRAEDLSLLRYLNESSSLHTVRQRYGGNLIHTYAGPSLIVVNPMQPLQIYSEKVIQMFKGCKQEDMPPHIFASAQIAYREMLNTRQDQSVVLMGRSGSGKTYNVHHILHYLAVSAGSVNNILTVEKLNAMTVLLEAFGNSRTILNTSASRFAQLTTLDFDHSGQVVSASVQVLLFEKTRVVRRPEGEPTFNVFYQLLAGVDSKLRSELQLNSLSDPNLFMTPLQKAEDKQRAVHYWSKIYAAMQTVQMTEDEIKSICSVLAAIYHLGVAGAVKGNNNKGQFARPAGAQRAATLLGISVEELGRNIFSGSGTATLTRSAAVRSSPADKNAEAHTTAMEALEGFVIGLYSDVFNAIVSMINRSVSSTIRSATSITVVDTPGFQNPGTCGRQSGASFEDLCHNYTQEKLQLLFHDLVFTTPQDRYSQENVECDFEFVTSSPAAMVSLIEKPSQQSLLSRPRPSSYHEHRDGRLHNDDVFSHTHTSSSSTFNHEHPGRLDNTHTKVRGQGLHPHHDNHTPHRSSSSSSSSSSASGFQSFSKIPVKVTSSLKSYQHLCHGTPGHHGNLDHDEVRTSTPEVRESEKKGLLWILDEEAIYPGATEDTFMDRFFTYHGEQKVKRDSLLRKASSLGNTFILNHFQGTNPVQYNASGWLKMCRENPISKVATQVLQDSKKSNIKELFNSVKAPVGGMVSGSIVGMEGSTSLRRVGSMRRTFMSGTAGLKKRSMCLQVKFQVDSIIETLRKTKCHFIHCMLPQANAGLCELRTPADMTPEKPDDILMNVPLVRSQFRGNEVLESVRIHRQGFPDHLTFAEFIQRFEGLIPAHVQPEPGMPEKSAVIQIVENLDIDKLNYRIGLSRVFFRAGALNRLESSRDDRVTGSITNFQSYCRGYLARKRLAKLRVQNVAISCIQKNVRKFYQIRDWDWWKLYVKVKPLLNVHRTEEELHDRELELEQMKTKLERIERERNDYKQSVDKLENRMVELTADLAEENTTATQASEMLETESAERMRLEKELKDIQGKHQSLRRNHEKLEMEIMQMRLWQADTLDGELDEDMADGGVYKDRYEKAMRELAFTKKQLSQQHEEELDQERASKKNVEKRLHESMEDTEDLRRQVNAAKRKSQKLVTEMQDSKLHLEEQMSRNNDLERKQRKFDAELSKAQEEARTERVMKDKAQRERDELSSEKYSLEKELQRVKGDVESQDAKYDRLQRELGDALTSAGARDDHEHASLKRSKAELEAKVLDQEEELDDQAGQIQQLEQTKVRLEMNLEKSRQQHIKETEEKDQEMEDLRYATQKKLKQMESQMEEEYEERKVQVQKNRDLEQQLHDLQSHAAFRDKGAEKRLRRDLRRTKALLKDAEVVLHKQKSSEGSKMTVRQLRNQLEDAEFASAAAVKAKKTMELELADLQQQLDELFKAKQEAENKSMSLMREKTEAQSQLEENEEDITDVMKKYKAVVQQQTVDQITMNDHLVQIDELTTEKDKLKAEMSDLRSRIQTYEESSVDKTVVQRLENKIRDLEARLELEIANKHRLEVQVGRMKEQMDRLSEEKEHLSTAKVTTEESSKKVQRQLRDLREEFSDVQKREMEVSHKYKANENKVAELEGDFEQNQSDLKLAFKRIADLQSALEDGIDSDDDLSDSEGLEDDDSDSDLGSYLTNHKRSPLSRRRGSLDSETRSRLESASSSYLTDTPSSPRFTNHFDLSEA